ncbi:hypothetical protein BOX15_Mlig007908g4 [Macrostomum lignano]|uniref:PH domain-containing protein n=1 Tax=Macrostomum lignano TaxID=282301 RepID=A0A267DCM2_9PLAT|nr:hypothetical protein BOX15_Mlig007908g4 [Macrostomum lignano]
MQQPQQPQQDDEDGGRSVASHTLGGLSSYAASVAATTDDGDSDARSIASAASGATSRRRRHQPKEAAYFAAKILLACERQAGRDLRLLCQGLPDEMAAAAAASEPADTDDGGTAPALRELLALLDSVRAAQQRFLSSLEQRLRAWEAASAAVAAALANGQAPPPTADDQRRLGDLLLEHLPDLLPPMRAYAQALPGRFLQAVDPVAFSDNGIVRRFESSRACHLPLACLLLGPARRPARLAGLCERLLAAAAGPTDAADCRAALRQLADAAEAVRPACDRAEQLCGLVELRRDLPSGLEGVLDDDRGGDVEGMDSARLIRIGWLRKPGSRRGGGGRLLCLLSDRLLILGRPSSACSASIFSASASAASASVASAAASATSTPTGGRGVAAGSSSSLLRLRTKIPLRGLRATEAPGGGGSGDRQCQLSLQVAADSAEAASASAPPPAIVLAARNRRQRDLWLRDLQAAAADAPPMASAPAPAAKATAAAAAAAGESALTSEQLQQQRALLPTRVCWHRCASVGFADIVRSHSCDLSGHLLRKLTSAPGWQRLWVAFSHLALFFYKSYRDEAPMATLPLIGYRVGPPDPSDQELVQGKSHVFKLQWKHHRYFFRADSEYTYNCWLETLSDAILPLAAEPEATRAPLRDRAD